MKNNKITAPWIKDCCEECGVENDTVVFRTDPFQAACFQNYKEVFICDWCYKDTNNLFWYRRAE